MAPETVLPDQDELAQQQQQPRKAGGDMQVVVRSALAVLSEPEARKPNQAQSDDHQQKNHLERVFLPHPGLNLTVDTRGGNGETVAQNRMSGKPTVSDSVGPTPAISCERIKQIASEASVPQTARQLHCIVRRRTMQSRLPEGGPSYRSASSGRPPSPSPGTKARRQPWCPVSSSPGPNSTC